MWIWPVVLCTNVDQCRVWVEWKCMEFVAAGRCTRKCLRLYQIRRNLTSGELGILLVVIQLGVPVDWKWSGSCTSQTCLRKRGKGQCDVCGAPLDDWADGGYVDVSFTCDECGFRSLKSWSCSEGRVWDLVTKSMLDYFREKRCQQGDTLGVWYQV